MRKQMMERKRRRNALIKNVLGIVMIAVFAAACLFCWGSTPVASEASEAEECVVVSAYASSENVLTRTADEEAHVTLNQITSIINGTANENAY